MCLACWRGERGVFNIGVARAARVFSVHNGCIEFLGNSDFSCRVQCAVAVAVAREKVSF